MKHTDQCGHENIAIVSEHEKCGIDSYVYDDDKKTLCRYFPHSYDYNKEKYNKKHKEHLDAIKDRRQFYTDFKNSEDLKEHLNIIFNSGE
jgi:hypothetical protein